MPRLTIEQLWVGLPVAIVVWRGFVYPLGLFDFWWHLKVGEIIVNNRYLPRTDIFSFTAAGKPFIVQNWLAEVLYYATYRLGGFPMLVFLNTVLLVVALLPVYLLCFETGSKLRLNVLAASLAALVLTFYGTMRPQVFSFVLFAIFYKVLHDFCYGRRHLLWILPILMVLWVNLHGGFLLGLGLVGLFLACESWRALIQDTCRATLSSRQLCVLGLVFSLCAIATLANPEAHHVFGYIRSVMGDPSSQLFVSEWQPPKIDKLQDVLMFFGPLGITIVALLHVRRQLDLTDIVLFLTFAIFGLKSSRNGIWFVLVAAPIISQNLPSVEYRRALQSLKRFRCVSSLLQRLESKKITAPPRYRLNFLIACAAALSFIAFSPWLYPKLYHASLLDPKTPVKAMDYIEKQGLEGNIYHPQLYGDYLIWRLWPRQRSFFDGRVHVFGEPFVREYMKIPQDSHWAELLSQYKIRYLLLSKDVGQTDSRCIIAKASNSSAWRVRYEDDRSVLFEKVY